MNKEQAKALREPFPAAAVGKLPKPYNRDAQKGNCRECGGYHGLPAVHLDYVGHAATTDRLLQVDPEWFWEPVAFDQRGLPGIDEKGGLWIRLTVAGVARLGYGHASGKTGPDAVKEAIGDAIRNAAMRFGVALDLWAKEDISATTSYVDTAEPVAPPELTRPVERLTTTPDDDAWATAPVASEPTTTVGPPKHPDAASAFRGLQAALKKRAEAEGWSRADVIGWVGLQVGRPIASTNDLTSKEVDDVRAILRGARREVAA